MKQGQSKKVISLLLSLAMIVGLVPATIISALAGDGPYAIIVSDGSPVSWDQNTVTMSFDANGEVKFGISGGISDGVGMDTSNVTKIVLIHQTDSAEIVLYDKPNFYKSGRYDSSEGWFRGFAISSSEVSVGEPYIVQVSTNVSGSSTITSDNILYFGSAGAIIHDPDLCPDSAPMTSGTTGAAFPTVTFSVEKGQTDSELSWSATGLEGSSLTFTGAENSTTATLSGTLGAAGRYSITITVTESGTEERTASYSFTLTINDKPKVYFDPNNGSGTQTVEVTGDEVTLPAAPTNEGYQFRGWYSGDKNYAPGAKVTITSDQWFYAVWEAYTMTVRLVSGNPVVGPLQLKGVKSGGTEEYIGYRYYDQPTSLVGDGANSFKVFVPDIVAKGYTGLKLYATVDGAYDTLIGDLNSFSVTTDNDSTVELTPDSTWYILADELERDDQELPKTDKDFDYYIIKTGRTISRPAMVSSQTPSDYTLKIRGSWRSEYEKSYKWANTYHSHVGGNSDGAFTLGTGADGYTLTPKLDLSKLKLTTDARVSGLVKVKNYQTNTLVNATPGSTVYASQEVDGITRSFQTTVDENGNYALDLYPNATATLWARDKLTSVSTNRVTTAVLTTGDATVNLSSDAPPVEVTVTITPASGNEETARKFLNAVNGSYYSSASVGLRINDKDWNWIYMGQSDPLTQTKTVYPSSLSASDQTGIDWSASGDYFHKKSDTFAVSGGKGTIRIEGLRLRPGALLNLTFEKNNHFRFAWFNQDGTLAGGTWSYPDSGDNPIRAPQTVDEATGAKTDRTGTLILALIPETYFNWVTKDTTLSGKDLTLGDQTFENAVTETWTVSLSDNHITDLGSYTVTAAASEDATYVTKPKSTLTTGATGFSSTNDIISFTGTVDIDNGLRNGKLEYLYLNTNVGYDYTGSVVEAVVNGEKMSVQADHWKSTSGVYLDFHTAPLDLPVTYTVYATPISVERDLVMTVEAQVSYDDRDSYSGITSNITGYRQLVGSATVAKPGMALSYLSPYVNSRSITLSGEGIAKRSNNGVGEVITFYDGEVQVAQAQTDWWGDWKVDLPLYDTDPVLATTHTITARRADGSISAPLTVVHCAQGPELTKFQWSFGDNTYKRDVGEGYAFWGTVANPTFYATFTNGNKLKTLEGFGVPVVFRIITTDGQIRYLPATGSGNEYTARLDTVLRSAISGVHCLFDPNLDAGTGVTEDGQGVIRMTPSNDSSAQILRLLNGTTNILDGEGFNSDNFSDYNAIDKDALSLLAAMQGGLTAADSFSVTLDGNGAGTVTGKALDTEDRDHLKAMYDQAKAAGFQLKSITADYDAGKWSYQWLNEMAERQIASDHAGLYTATIYFSSAEDLTQDRGWIQGYADLHTHTEIPDNGPVMDTLTLTDGTYGEGENLAGGTYLVELSYSSYPSKNLYSLSVNFLATKDFDGFYQVSPASLVSLASPRRAPILISSAGPLTGDMLRPASACANLVSFANRTNSLGQYINPLGWNGDYYQGQVPVPRSLNVLGVEIGDFGNLDGMTSVGAAITSIGEMLSKGQVQKAMGAMGSICTFLNLFFSAESLADAHDRFERMDSDLENLLKTDCGKSLDDAALQKARAIYWDFVHTKDKALKIMGDAWALAAGFGIGSLLTGGVATACAEEAAAATASGAAPSLMAKLAKPIAKWTWPLVLGGVAQCIMGMEESLNAERMTARAYNSAYMEISMLMYKQDTEDCNKDKKDLEWKIHSAFRFTQEQMALTRDAGSNLPITIGHDPAGVVYEGVIENPVKDATVTLYYAVDDGGNPVGEKVTKNDVSGAIETHHNVVEEGKTIAQIRPADDVKALVPREAVQVTREDGRFQWGVPEGLWFVGVAKDGLTGNSNNDMEATVAYAGATTDGIAVTRLLPVLPIQLDVNIPLVDAASPYVLTGDTELLFTTDGVYVTFSKYMEDTGDSNYANYAESVLNPANYVLQTAAGQNIGVTVEPVTQGHTPTNLQGSASRTYTKAVKLTPVAADAALYTDSAQLLIRGRVVSYAGTPMSGDYVSGVKTIAEPITLAVPTFSGTDSDGTVFSGLDSAEKTVPTGDSVTLTAADTGATIYYTTDGTDPLDSDGKPASRAKTYDGPIAVTGKITVWARAARTGAKPSETAKGVFTPYTMVNHGVVVTVVSADPGLDVDGVTVTLNGQTRTVSGGAVGFYGLTAGTYTLTVPQSNRFNAKTVTVEVPEGLNRIALTVTLEKRSTSMDASYGEVLYQVSASAAQNGMVTIFPTYAAAGQRVTVAVTPEEGYELDTLTVADRRGNSLTLTETDGKFTFTMPSGPVTVTAAFREHKPEPVPIENPFPDVSEEDWYYDAVLWAYANGITTGKPDGTFDPKGDASRAEVVTFLWRCVGEPAPQGTASDFPDVAESAWYYNPVQWAFEQGIARGFEDGTFRPSLAVTREQFVAFLYRTVGAAAADGENPFTDVNSGDWSYAAIQWAAKEGVANGTGGNLFSPDWKCDRSQVVTMLYRWFGKI